MCDAPKYCKTRVSKVLADINRLRTAIRAHDDEAAEQAWEKVERWTGFIAGSVSRADTLTALEQENAQLLLVNDLLGKQLIAAWDEISAQEAKQEIG